MNENSVRQTVKDENIKNPDLKECECGFLNKIDAKFCACCGIKLEEQKEENTIMYCDQCGNHLSPKDVFCDECGNKILKDVGIDDIKYLSNRVDIIRVRLGIKVLSIISIICFFMNFVTESAMGFGISMNGFEAAFGTVFGSGTEAMVDSEDLKVNIFVLFSLISCVTASITVFQSGNIMKTVAGMHITSAVCLILYMLTYSMYYGYDEWNALMSIEYGFGIWAVIIINVVIGVLAWFVSSKESEDTK